MIRYLISLSLFFVCASAATAQSSVVNFPLLRKDSVTSEYLWSEVRSRRLNEFCSDCKSPKREDLSATFKAVWNHQFLVFEVKVKDDEVDTSGSRKIFELDGVELLIGMKEFQGEGESAPLVHLFATADGRWQAKGRGVERQGLKVSSEPASDGYTLTIELPISKLSDRDLLEKNYAFNVVVNDRDDGTRDAQLFWRYSSIHWKNTESFTNFGIVQSEDRPELRAKYLGESVESGFPRMESLEQSPFSEVCPTCRVPSSRDINAEVATAWDDQYLYLSIDAEDDEFTIWGDEPVTKSDSLAILIDGNDDRGEDFGRDDHQIFIRADGAIDAPGYQVGSSDIIAQARISDDSYRLEVAISWAYLGGKAPQPSQSYGIALVLNDVDTESRGKKLFWHYPESYWETTADYGRLVLDGANYTRREAESLWGDY